MKMGQDYAKNISSPPAQFAPLPLKDGSFITPFRRLGVKLQDRHFSYSMNGYLKSVAGINVSLIVLGLTQRIRLR
jgi:hypothetical protein